MLRYRLANGLASWHPRDGSSVIKDIMLRHLTAQQLRHNTTRGFPGLTPEERKEIDDGNKKSRKYQSRAGKRALNKKASVAENWEDEEEPHVAETTVAEEGGVNGDQEFQRDEAEVGPTVEDQADNLDDGEWEPDFDNDGDEGGLNE